MDIGVVLQTTPPAARVIDLAKRAETHGFSHVWTFDSHILWEEPYVIYSQILAETRNVVVGPMVTNPATRDWTVTASTYATLNEMYGNRTVCGIGRGDSAVRVTNGKPTTLATMRESIHVIRELACGRGASTTTARRSRCRGRPRASSRVWGAGYGPKALKLIGETCDGFILQLADLSIANGRSMPSGLRPTAVGRDPDDITICVAAPAYVGPTDLPYMRDQCPMVRRHGRQPRGRHRRRATATIAGAAGLDRLHQGPPGVRLQPTRPVGQHPHATFVPDEIVDRFCILGPVEAQMDELDDLKALGVDQFAIYLQHDGKDHTLPSTASTSSRAHEQAGQVAHVRAGRTGRARARRTALFVLRSPQSLAWELYKADRPRAGRRRLRLGGSSRRRTTG